jgi:hypothetical protein
MLPSTATQPRLSNPHEPFQTYDAAAPHEIVMRRFSAEAFEALKSRASAEIGGVIVASVPGGFHVVHGTFETADDYTFKPCEAFCEARSPLE